MNCDRLVPNRSSYVSVHDEDFLFGNDPWFRGLTVKYGPDGGVFVSDWHDLGECHDNDGSHRTSGRIYKVVYGDPNQRELDLHKMDAAGLGKLHLHPNEWWVRRARRILHERTTAGHDISAARQTLRTILEQGDELTQLRVLWTLFVINDLTESECVRLLGHKSEHVRRWAVRFLVDNSFFGQPAFDAMKAVDELHTSDKSMMPEGMLHSFDNQEVRDLILYLASPRQVSLLGTRPND